MEQLKNCKCSCLEDNPDNVKSMSHLLYLCHNFSLYSRVFGDSLIRHCLSFFTLNFATFDYGFPEASLWLTGKSSACNAGDLVMIPGLGRSLGEGNGTPLQYSCLENSLDQGSLVGYSPWGHKKLGTTELWTVSLKLEITFYLYCILSAYYSFFF